MNKYSNKIITSGPMRIKWTKDYKKQVKTIKNEKKIKYQDLIKNEKNILKKIILIIKKAIETKKEIRKLTSLDNLYLHKKSKIS